MIGLEAKARETAEEIEELYWTEAERLRIEKNRKELKQIILSALEAVVKEKDELLELLTYSYRVNTGLKESIDGALAAGSDIDVPISGGLIKRASEALATESRPTK